MTDDLFRIVRMGAAGSIVQYTEEQLTILAGELARRGYTEAPRAARDFLMYKLDNTLPFATPQPVDFHIPAVTN